MHELYELKETLCKNLEEYGRKKDLKAGDLDVIDKLSHSIKNLDKVIEKYEEEEYSGARGRGSNAKRDSMGRYSSAMGMMDRDGYSMRDNMMRDGYSNERGGYSNERGGNYSNRSEYSNRGGYSRNNNMIMELRELMEDAPDERTRMEFDKFIRKMESM